MGEAMLVRKGGAALRGLVVITPPDKLQYYNGELPDMEGIIVGAQFGTNTIPLHDTAWTYSPTRALEPTDTSILISATIGRQTKTVGVPITVENFTSNLNDNSWAQIARAAEVGIADQIWNIGDVKYDYYDGNYIGFRIIGFGHDYLDETDAKYNDASYNGNTKKAAITFQAETAFGRFGMNLTSTQIGGWNASNMRVTKMPEDIALLPADLQAVMRTVKKYACGGGSGDTNDKNIVKSADALFLLSAFEMVTSTNEASQYEKNYTSIYEWYADGNPLQKGNYKEWLRSCHAPRLCSTESHFCDITTSNNVSDDLAGNKYDYYPAFCV